MCFIYEARRSSASDQTNEEQGRGFKVALLFILGLKVLNADLNRSWVASLYQVALPACVAGGVIFLLGVLGQATDSKLLVAPLGASAALVWMVPSSPFAHPRAVIGGSLVAASIGLVAVGILGASPIAAGLGVALAMIGMKGAKVFHPPAAALPILIVSTQPTPLNFLTALTVATFVIVTAGALFHQMSKKDIYPNKWL